jgi:hypothetical protein
MKMRELYPSKYLKADDVDEQGGEVAGIIKGVRLEEMQDNEGAKEDRPVLFFSNLPKGMVLNRTNADRIAAVFGDESEEWRGKVVTLYTEQVTAFGKTTNAIRLRVAKPKPNAAPVAAAVPAEPADLSEAF